MPAERYPFVLTERFGQHVYEALVEMVEDRHHDPLIAIDGKVSALTAGIDAKFAAMNERFERRLAEELGRLRGELSGLRNEMSHQRADLMKWAMVYWVSHAAAVAAIVTVLR
jgi:hypothetical protein